MIWSADSLSKALDITCPKHLHANQIQFNSKDVKSGDVFIALKGTRDGHEFVLSAAKNGANIIIINHDRLEGIKVAAQAQIGSVEHLKYKAFIEKLICVHDTQDALERLAKYKRDTSKAKFITITGSAGKTSTKEVLNIILSRFGKSFASRGNFNNKLGLAINLASMPDDIDYAVLELGMNAAGEISCLTRQARPHIAAITNIFGVHIEYFGSVEKIAEAKCEIFEGLDQEKGIAILPGDYIGYVRCISKLEQNGIQNIRVFRNHLSTKADSNTTHLINRLSYELPSSNRKSEDYVQTVSNAFDTDTTDTSIVDSPEIGRIGAYAEATLARQHMGDERQKANASMTSYEYLGTNVELEFDISNTRARVIMPYIPKHIAENFTLCLLIAKELGLDLQASTDALRLFTLGTGRGKIVSCTHQGKELQIITDYYNSNPESLKRALENLSSISFSLDYKYSSGVLDHCQNPTNTPRKVAIIGDMGELGEKAIAEHQNILPHVEAAGVELLILIGELARHISDKDIAVAKRTFESEPLENFGLQSPSVLDMTADNTVSAKFGRRMSTEDEKPISSNGSTFQQRARPASKLVVSKTYKNIDDFLGDIDSLIQHNDLILIKASRFMKFERIAKYLGIDNVL